MEYTPECNGYLECYKSQHCYDCSDSGYSGFFQSAVGVDSCRSPEDFNETPKENLKLSAQKSPKNNCRESVWSCGRDSREVLQPSPFRWCETPKVYKRDASLRHRLLVSKPTTLKNDNSRSPCIRMSESSVGARSERWLSVSFESLDLTSQELSNSLTLEQDVPLSGRKRRLLFSQVRTSTREDGKLNTGPLTAFERTTSFTERDFSGSNSPSDQFTMNTSCLGTFLPALTTENSQSPVSRGENILCDSSSASSTPSFTQTPKYTRSLYEDSGFGSLTTDKSQDSSVNHDGSYQELLTSASRGNCETPNLADAKWRSRLQRQNRLSTLKEGGSQSEEDSVDRKHHQKCHSQSKEDDVFSDDATPRSVPPATCKYFNSQTSAKCDNTPLRTTTAKTENVTPSNPAITPLRTTPINLSLTPALQLVHKICQYKLQMMAGQSQSLKEELKSTAALAKTPVIFGTTMPLAGLIGRKMGLGKVDILTELKKRNLRHILAVIFSKLDSESLYRCTWVCKGWNEIIQQDKQASSRRRSHLRKVEAAVELGAAVPSSDAETRVALLKRSALKTVQAQSRTSSYCTPQSANDVLTPLQHSAVRSGGSGGGSSSKRDKFLEVAKTLFNDECLKACPRCQHPARCHSVRGEGVCSREDCGFQFCTSCLCAFHGSRECGSQSVGRRKKDDLLPGSARSKRNVRRL
ncbi:F-box only protein 43 [Cololabis saira]|uniref:F-box only protein 43 n=1 Tax=Cololabis saira TaxID=129043 RepID=UPI002AD435A4|nr:F-box only protein 43 [Cololabis saira]